MGMNRLKIISIQMLIQHINSAQVLIRHFTVLGSALHECGMSHMLSIMIVAMEAYSINLVLHISSLFGSDK